MKIFSVILPLLLGLAPSCKDSSQIQTHSDDFKNLKFSEAFPNIDFKRPVDFQTAKDDNKLIYVIEQQGLISVIENSANAKEKITFLDIESKVDDSGNEEGLLGLAFHPDYKTNGYFYVNYTVSSSETLISRFSVDKNDPKKADPKSERILLRFNQPYGNHNGGQLAFGPDGFLYISVGDGGSGGDPKGNGQNANTLLGSILRIDIDHAENGMNYAIPADNPFVGDSNKRPEIYAFGLRNPWRISFDSETGRLWCADVGQNKFEEVDIIEKGGNYGWNEMEGLHSFENGENSSLYLAPVLEIPQSTGDKSITGGFVYRGKAAPSLIGKYIFADYVSGRIYALSENADGTFTHKTIFDSKLNISAFGEDQNRELYFCAFNGKVYTFSE